MTLEPKDNEIRQIFDLFDSEKSGKVSTDMLASLIRAFNQNPTRRDVQMFAAEVDPHKTGFFDFADFSRTFLKKWRDPCREEDNIRQAFQLFDKTKSGYIKIRDMCLVLKTIGDGLTLDEIDDFVKLCQNSGFTKEDTIDYQEVSRLLAGGAK